MEWYYKLEDVRGGPLDHDAICRMVADGLLPLEARVWREGFPRFLPASILPGFKEIRAKAEGAQAPAEPAPAGAALTALMVDPWSPPADVDLDVVAPLETSAEPIDQSQVIGVRAFFAGGQLMTERLPDVTQARPWVRLWARQIDGVVDALIVWCVLPLVMPPLRTVGQICIAGVCLLVLEAVYLSLFGTTPGKCLLGISVRGIEGGKPGFGEALIRAIMVRIKGCSLGLLTGMLAYGRLMRNGSTSWDESGGFIIRHERIGAGRAMFAVVGCALGIFMTSQPLMAASKEISNLVQAQSKAAVGPGAPADNRGKTFIPSEIKPKPVRKAPSKKIIM